MKHGTPSRANRGPKNPGRSGRAWGPDFTQTVFKGSREIV